MEHLVVGSCHVPSYALADGHVNPLSGEPFQEAQNLIEIKAFKQVSLSPRRGCRSAAIIEGLVMLRLVQNSQLVLHDLGEWSHFPPSGACCHSPLREGPFNRASQEDDELRLWNNFIHPLVSDSTV